VRIRGYFSKQKGVREQKSLGNTALEKIIISVAFQNHTKHVNMQCWPSADSVIFKQRAKCSKR
jgi:hypothetical protein